MKQFLIDRDKRKRKRYTLYPHFSTYQYTHWIIPPVWQIFFRSSVIVLAPEHIQEPYF